MREKHLRGAALAAEEVDRVAPRPRVGRVADGAQGLDLWKGAIAVIAGDGSGEVHILFTTDFAADRAAPAHRHLS